MKITRKGNPNGIDIDYEVTDITTEQADDLHKFNGINDKSKFENIKMKSS
jgi:hypothetical protein